MGYVSTMLYLDDCWMSGNSVTKGLGGYEKDRVKSLRRMLWTFNKDFPPEGIPKNDIRQVTVNIGKKLAMVDRRKRTLDFLYFSFRELSIRAKGILARNYVTKKLARLADKNRFRPFSKRFESGKRCF